MSENLTQGSILKHILKMSIPISIGLFFNTMFNVVDTFYAGQLGTSSLAGMSLSFSVFFILIAIVSGISTGVSALLSISEGKSDLDSIEALTANGLFLTIVLSLTLSISGFIFAPFLLSLLGARGDTLNEGSKYVQAIYTGTIFFGLNSVFNAILTSRGITKPYRNFLILGFFLNLILDPLFIFGWFGLPKLGTMGVAIATIIVQIVGSLYLWMKVKKFTHKNIKQINWDTISVKNQLDILSQGVPASLNMMTIALGVFVINFYIYRYGNDASIAGYGAAMRIEQIALLPALGLNAAAMAIAGQNYGAGFMLRVRSTYHYALMLGIGIMSVGMIIIYPLATSLITIFNSDKNVIFEGARYLRIEFIAFNAYIVLNIGLSILQAIKKPHFAVWIGIYRQIIMPVLLFNLLAGTLGLKLVGIWWGIVITTWSGALILIWITHFELKKLLRLITQ